MAKTRFDSEAEKQVYRFMLQLGYPESLIRKAVKTARGYRADFVVYDDLDEPLLVIEVKSNLQLPDPNNEQELKFHPIIRQIQTYAKDLGALYYLLTDGDEYLWFTTAPTGRPRLLDSPITYQQVRTDYPPLKPSKESLLTIFRRVIDVGRNEFSVYNTHEYAIVIFARLLEERGDDRFSIALLEPILQNDREPPFNEIGFSASEFRERKFYYKSLKILSEITISAGIPQDILFALDEVFINPLIRLEPRIPRWLANFIVSLEDINTSASVVDLSCGYGDIIAAAILRNRQHPPRSLIGITQNSQAALWARIQELVLDRTFYFVT
jgi:hypothetical protein